MRKDTKGTSSNLLFISSHASRLAIHSSSSLVHNFAGSLPPTDGEIVNRARIYVEYFGICAKFRPEDLPSTFRTPQTIELELSSTRNMT